MNKFTKFFLVFLGALAFIAMLLLGGFVYSAGYWENIPIFDRISGPSRFKQFVTNPIPKDIYDLRGGYSGFPQGQVVTHFRYKGDVKNFSFITDWNQVSEAETDKTGLKTEKKFVKRKVYADGSKSERFLFFDEENKKGFLYIP